MKKVLYSIFVMFALAATSVWAAPVQMDEAAGSTATSVSAGSSSMTSVSTVSSAVGVALVATGSGDGPNTGATTTMTISTQQQSTYLQNNSSCRKAISERVSGSTDNYVTGANECSRRIYSLKYEGG